MRDDIPVWRTSTVVAICEQMRRTGDRSGLPILADALQEEGYGHEETLLSFRNPESMSLSNFHRWIGMVVGDGTEEAVDRIEEFVKRITEDEEWDSDDRGFITYDNVMGAAHEHIANGHATFCLPFDTPEFLYNSAVMHQFWEDFRQVTGVGVGEDKDDSFFRCAC